MIHAYEILEAVADFELKKNKKPTHLYVRPDEAAIVLQNTVDHRIFDMEVVVTKFPQDLKGRCENRFFVTA